MSRQISARTRIRLAITRKRREINRLQARVTTLAREVSELEDDLRALDRIGAADIEAPRTTSITRIAAERAILTQLMKNVPPITSSEQLWIAASLAGVTSRSTFRSHLNRMSKKGLIAPVRKGEWQLHPDIKPDLAAPDEVIRQLRQIFG